MAGRTQKSDVLVVGAGPTGLLAAGDLAAAGHQVTLVERREETTSNLSRALVVHARTLEQLDARGLADELVTTGATVDELGVFGHAVVDPTTLRSRFPFVLITGQYEVERLLERRAREAGVTFRYGAEVVAVRQDQDGVEADIVTPEHAADSAGTLRASYLIGTDGVHSAVREALGLPFPGKSVVRSIVLADVRLTETPPSPFLVNAIDDSFALIGTFGDGWYRVMGWNRNRQLPDTEPAGLDEVRDFTRQALGSDYGMHDPRWISRFHSDERQAPRYRVGRVFLAGDAAHVHSPAGGMGMNTGLQDAANLSWKLSAVLRGQAPAALLESYHDERHPVGAMVLRLSGTLIRLALVRSTAGGALRSTAAEVLNRIRPLADRAIRTISGIGIRYRRPRGSHPLTGKRAPDLALTGGRLYEALRAGSFVLVTPGGGADGAVNGGALTGGAAGAPVPGDGRVVHAEFAGDSRRTLLVRPDGHIAWAADKPDPDGLRRALSEWTGSPTARVAVRGTT